MRNYRRIFCFIYIFLFRLIISQCAYSQDLANNQENAKKFKDNLPADKTGDKRGAVAYSLGQIKEESTVADFTIAGIEMQRIQGGTFTMGSSDSEATSIETPHTVTVGSFAIMKYEVTVAEFKRFIDATGYQTDADKGTGGFGSLLRHGNTKIRTYTKGVNWKCGTSGEVRP